MKKCGCFWDKWRIGLSLLIGLWVPPGLSGEESGQDTFADALRSARVSGIDEGLPPEVLRKMQNARLVLLGESTHGTREFYVWRDRISRALIEDGGFSFIAVEGDWASIYALNRYVKDKADAPASAKEALMAQQRWPQWMWGNEEVAELGEWLRRFNAGRPPAERVGIYGMDVYSPWAAADKTLAYTRASLGDGHRDVERALARFLRFRDDVSGYIRAGFFQRGELAEGYRAKIEQLSTRLETSDDPAGTFSAKQGLWTVKRAHGHFMAMADPAVSSWNPRALHMHETVQRLLSLYGSGSQGIVWAHNTHIGDARATPMAMEGDHNIGELSRRAMGNEAVFSLGFSTHRGSVLAGRAWEAPMQRMRIPEAGPGSLEAILHDFFPEGAVLHWRFGYTPLREREIAHRAIGVVYMPEHEFPGNYVPTRLSARYDALVFIPETRALTPLARP
ncbi:MAG: erythromycin esterase family protein [Opitutales bacterium]|nr:erythromycin esterase family protein [Opitutales bacterium]